MTWENAGPQSCRGRFQNENVEDESIWCPIECDSKSNRTYSGGYRVTQWHAKTIVKRDYRRHSQHNTGETRNSLAKPIVVCFWKLWRHSLRFWEDLREFWAGAVDTAIDTSPAELHLRPFRPSNIIDDGDLKKKTVCGNPELVEELNRDSPKLGFLSILGRKVYTTQFVKRLVWNPIASLITLSKVNLEAKTTQKRLE